jgi:hypothetical protein
MLIVPGPINTSFHREPVAPRLYVLFICGKISELTERLVPVVPIVTELIERVEFANVKLE